MGERKQLPLIVLNQMVIFPKMMLHFDLAQTANPEAAKKAVESGKEVFLVMNREIPESEKKTETDTDSYRIGVIAAVRQIVKLPNSQSRVLVYGVERGRILQAKKDALGYLTAEIEVLPMEETEISPVQETALFGVLLETIEKFMDSLPKSNKELLKQLKKASSFRQLMEQSVSTIPVPPRIRQALLEADNIMEQFQQLIQALNTEIEVLNIRRVIQEKVQKSIDKNQKEYILREQMKVIREELGEAGPLEESERFLKAVDELDAPEEILETIRTEIRRFTYLGYNNSESSVVRNYIETMISLPWNRVSKDKTDIKSAERILQRDHYGLEDVKKRVLEFLAVHSMQGAAPSPILCLVGPPGTGKTSIAKSMAEAMNRKYVRICLGGVRDEAEIRGHRRTYLASMPGRFIQGLREAKVSNPLMLLDEIDKIGSDYKGDPSAALLEVLDSAQNNRFVDHFIEKPVDLSKVVFVATANTTETIPRPLLDRMEVIEISSYTQIEKQHIAADYLVPAQRKKHGLTKEQLRFGKKGLNALIEGYTREAGVRGLERKIGEVCRKAVLSIVEQKEQGKEPEKITITEKNLEQYLGHPYYHKETLRKKPEIGLVHGLAWTSVGGETLEIEVNTMPGKGELVLTGRMGDVMKESALTGISYIRSVSSRYHIADDYFDKHDIHIHIPEGAVPKDGPSAGITMATAVLSAVTGIPARQDIAMTGEITLRGRVLPIGGLKEKMLAAKNLGIHSLLVPEENRADVDKIPEEIKSGMEITFVSGMNQVLSAVLVLN